MNKEKANILLVDDDEDVLLAAKYLLKKHFSKVFAEIGPDNVAQLLSQNTINVALLDMNYSMGETSGQDGLNLLKKIRDLSPGTRVILMTAYGDIDLAIKAIKEGAFDFIVKPWDNVKLVSTIQSALKKTKASEMESRKSSGQKTSSNLSKYKPFSEVERIFMFLDLRASTTIAEKLGHVKYFELLNDFFSDIAKPIAKYDGEIYQYVGDEVVITWDISKGLSDDHCLHCFFDITETINNLKNRYLKRYSIFPQFKAGMHVGTVSTGMVGTIKKEIIYTGDVLNTASRIENLCNRHHVNLLISKELVDKLSFSGAYKPKKIGATVLKGKSAETSLYSIVK